MVSIGIVIVNGAFLINFTLNLCVFSKRRDIYVYSADFHTACRLSASMRFL